MNVLEAMKAIRDPAKDSAYRALMQDAAEQYKIHWTQEESGFNHDTCMIHWGRLCILSNLSGIDFREIEDGEIIIG